MKKIILGLISCIVFSYFILTDFNSIKIAEGYYFKYGDKYQTSIYYKEFLGLPSVIIDSDVINFLLLEGTIFVSSKPITYEFTDNSVKSIRGDICKYWSINVNNHDINGPFKAIKIQENLLWRKLDDYKALTSLSKTGIECPLVNRK